MRETVRETGEVLRKQEVQILALTRPLKMLTLVFYSVYGQA